LDATRCDLGLLADVATEATAHAASAAGVELRRDLRPAFVTGDPTRLHQVITNLLSNAVKFTPPGGHVSVTVDSDDTTATLAVADSGAGIAEDELPRVFERFWRGRNASSSPGAGIGLAIVANLVAAHHGTVQVESSPGQGSRVVVTLPAAPPKR